MAMNQGAPKTSNMPSRSRTGARPGCWSKYCWTRCGEMFCCGNRLPKMAATATASSSTSAVRMDRNSRHAWRSDPAGAGGVRPSSMDMPLQRKVHRAGPDAELVEEAPPQAGHEQQPDDHQHSPSGQFEQPEAAAQGGKAPDRAAEAERGDQERHPEPEGVCEQQDGATLQAPAADG